jgi:hypothetical protein
MNFSLVTKNNGNYFFMNLATENTFPKTDMVVGGLTEPLIRLIMA